MKLWNLIKDRYLSDIATIEEKSFWIVAVMTIVMGFSMTTTFGSYSSILPVISLSMMCIALPAAIMLFVMKKNDYHLAYPLLCITTGAITMPTIYLFSGGFLSGAILFCLASTVVTVLCYSKRLRFLSFGLCLLSNTVAFLYVYFFGALYPIKGSELLYSYTDSVRAVYNDMIFCYYGASIGLFFCINFIVNDIRRYRLNQEALQKFFDKEKRNEILQTALDENSKIDSVHRKAAIVFADITNFTTITETLPSDLVLQFLNEFFTGAEASIHSTNGIIDKFIGDCVMAYWLEVPEENCVYNAVRAMLDLKMNINKQAEEIYQKYGTELNFTVGISYGDVILGDFGSNAMHDFTIIGDAVNVANRIESFAAGGEILISDSAAQRVTNLVSLENVESNYFLKGKNKPIDFYRITGIAAERQDLNSHKEDSRGYTLYVCGCRGSSPVSGLRFSEYGGETSCYVVRKGDYAVVVDCGTGLKNAASILEGCKKIDVLFTHVHYDHILGLLMFRFPENADVCIFGNFSSVEGGVNSLEAFMHRPYWPVKIMDIPTTNVDLEREYTLHEDVRATFYRSDHPDDGCVIKLMCEDKKVVFLFDCEKAASLDDAIAEGSDILFFDGMYDDNDPIDHTGWGHGTWQDAVRFAEGRSIRKLLITHHDPSLGDHSLMMREIQTREMNPNISFAKSGDIFSL